MGRRAQCAHRCMVLCPGTSAYAAANTASTAATRTETISYLDIWMDELIPRTTTILMTTNEKMETLRGTQHGIRELVCAVL